MRAALEGRLSSSRLDNGLEIHLLESRDAPVVTTALTYRTGAARDPAGRSGTAHFLEHMMFKGSRRWSPGAIDRRTRELGGRNNAFTSHDSTTYYFSFGAESWRQALDIEADRMGGLDFDPEEVASERSVILEEISMYEAEPWEALDRRVQAALYEGHPYGRPIIGLRPEVAAITRRDLATFHTEHYRADRAVLVVAGDLGRRVEERIAGRFGGLEGRGAPAEPLPSVEPIGEPVRVEVERHGVPRYLLALPAPPAAHADVAALRLVCSMLASGRSSRLNDRLVERDSLCGWVVAGLGEGVLGSTIQISAELTPGSDPERLESRVTEELARLRAEPPAEAETDRARRVLEADWVFAHERIEAQALMLSQAAAHVDIGYPLTQMEAVGRLEGDDLLRVAQRWLDPERGCVLGWARPGKR